MPKTAEKATLRNADGTYLRLELLDAYSMTSGQLAAVTIYDGCTQGRSGLTKGKKVGTITGDTWPNLFTALGHLYAEHGSWRGIADLITREVGR